jgi:uncharacterized protein (DUF58 family)
MTLRDETSGADLLKRVRGIEIRTRRTVSEAFAGQFRSAFRGRGMEFEEVRPYQVGDDVRSIDWNVSARAGTPHVKLFREERELLVFLAVDLSASLDFGTRGGLKRDTAAEIAATVALSANRSNDKTGLLLFTDRIEKVVPPRKGSRHVLGIVRDCLSFRPEGRGTDLALALGEMNRLLRRRAVVFVLSDFLPGVRGGDWRRPMALLRQRHDVIPVAVRDAFEREVPRVGFLDTVDAESGSRTSIDTFSAAGRRRYRELAEARERSLDEGFRRLKLDAVRLESGQDPARPLETFFRRREARRSR